MFNVFSWWWQLLQHGKGTCGPDELPAEDREPPPAEELQDDAAPDDEDDDELTDELDVSAANGRVRSIGAWTGSGSLGGSSDAIRDIAIAKAIGLRRIDLMVNDHSLSRQPRDFGTYSRARIVAFCQRAVGEGLAVHLTSWIMPHEHYLRQMGPQLIDLVGQCGARSVCFDAEEPWVKAGKPMAWEEAGQLAAEVMEAVPFGVTGIGYASRTKLGPLVRRARYMAPQCYSTAGNKLDPRTAAVRLSNYWRTRFGDRELVVGLAGYKQKGRPGYTKDRFMRTAFDAARAAGATDVVYWSLAWIRQSRETAAIIKSLAAQVQQQPAIS